MICCFISAAAATFIFSHHGTKPVVAADAPVQVVKPPVAVASEFTEGQFDAIIKSAVSDELTVPPPTEWTTVSVQSGQTLSNVFDQVNLPADDWMNIVKLGGDAAQLRKLRAGDRVKLRIAAGQLQELIYALDETRTLSVRRADEGFEFTTLTAAIEHRHNEASGVIENSLFADGHKAGLNDRMIMEVADLFGYDIDFAQDLQEGDRFSVVYEELYKDGKKLRTGDILAAEFINQGKSYRAVRFVAKDGTKAYYTPQGQSLRKAFIRTPVDFARISSGFTMHRWHPILHRMRAHTGTDYACPIGTPVHASGGGTVEFMGRKGGYGNVVILRHNSTYETIYGHLSRFGSGMRTGGHVQQGQVIAYVGMTGLATGPHLHYEFRVNGLPVNPEKVILPRSMPIAPQQLATFRAEAAPLVAALDSRHPQVADARH